MRRPDEMPVFGTQASRFNDDGVTALYQGMLPRLVELGPAAGRRRRRLPEGRSRHSSSQMVIVPPARTRYLAEIATPCAGYKAARPCAAARIAREIQQLRESQRMLREANADKVRAVTRWTSWRRARTRLEPAAAKLLAMWPHMQKAYAGDEYVVKIRDKEIRTDLVPDLAVGHRSARSRCPPTRTTASC
jgi:methylmalonyl-CoA mutase